MYRVTRSHGRTWGIMPRRYARSAGSAHGLMIASCTLHLALGVLGPPQARHPALEVYVAP